MSHLNKQPGPVLISDTAFDEQSPVEAVIAELLQSSHHDSIGHSGDPKSLHLIFQIDEILRQICSSLRLPPKDLLRFALTCKAIKDPALDILWGLQLTLMEALCPFVAYGVLKRTTTQRYDHLVRDTTLIRIPSQDDLMRYQSYGRRVRRLNRQGYSRAKFAIDSFAKSLNGFLFPHLIVLDLSTEGGFNFKGVNGHLLAPSIRDLRINALSTLQVAEFIREVSNTRTGLCSFSIWIVQTNHEGSEFEMAIDSLLVSQVKLDYLSWYVPLPLFSSLMGLPLQSKSITNLQLRHPKMGDIPNQLPITISAFHFPNLVEVHIDSPARLFDICSLLPPESHPSLRSVVLCSSTSDSDRLLSCLESLAKYRSLEKLSITTFDMWVKSQAVCQVLVDHIRPLMSSQFGDLVKLSISGLVHFHISNDELGLLGDSMPRLRSADFGPRFVGASKGLLQYPESRIDLLGMISFVSKLSNLRRLRLSVRVFPMDVGQIRMEGVQLEKWEILASTIEEPAKVLSILMEHIPTLNELTLPFGNGWENEILQPRSSDLPLDPSEQELRKRLLDFKELADGLSGASESSIQTDR